MLRNLAGCLILLVLLTTSILPAKAQTAPAGPVYIYQEGDTFYGIAHTFHTTTTRLALANYISHIELVEPGWKLVIPGFSDLSGTITPITVGLGDTQAGLVRKTGSDPSVFRRINFLTNPDEIQYGQRLFILTNGDTGIRTRIPVPSGLTDLELAAANGVNPWTASEMNDLGGRWRLVANDTIYLPAGADGLPGEILPGITDLSISSLGQGKTAQMTAVGSAASDLSGSLLDHPLRFFDNGNGTLESLQGIPRMTEAGPVTLVLSATDANSGTFTLEQTLLIADVDYGYDPPMQVADELVDAALTQSEMDFILQHVADAPPEKMWSGTFSVPTDSPTCRASTFGSLRSFNGSDYDYFHAGTDYYICESESIFAAADGVVVYTGELKIRGNVTIISHGRGVYSVYCHQSAISVAVGQNVKAGEVIGQIGKTGRVTGPHLHFEIWVGGAQVDPDDWLNGMYP